MEQPTPDEALPLVVVPSDCVDAGLTVDEWLTDPLNISVLPAGDWTFRLWAADLLITESASVSIRVYDVDEFGVQTLLFSTSHPVSFGVATTLHSWTESRPVFYLPEYGTHRVYAAITATGTLLCTGLNVRLETDASAKDSSVSIPVGNAPTAVPGS